jgi:hypothetical protein
MVLAACVPRLLGFRSLLWRACFWRVYMQDREICDRPRHQDCQSMNSQQATRTQNDRRCSSRITGVPITLCQPTLKSSWPRRESNPWLRGRLVSSPAA